MFLKNGQNLKCTRLHALNQGSKWLTMFINDTCEKTDWKSYVILKQTKKSYSVRVGIRSTTVYQRCTTNVSSFGRVWGYLTYVHSEYSFGKCGRISLYWIAVYKMNNKLISLSSKLADYQFIVVSICSKQ